MEERKGKIKNRIRGSVYDLTTRILRKRKWKYGEEKLPKK